MKGTLTPRLDWKRDAFALELSLASGLWHVSGLGSSTRCMYNCSSIESLVETYKTFST